MAAYYNEFKPEAANMLLHLIANGLIAHGDVDQRPIQEVTANDIKGYAQCHFFAGIGGWSVALRLAGWDDSRPVWTGSCPCQPFSSAGKQKGKADERHLWPVWFRLIRESKPGIVFGEQVSSAIRHGWWDDVADDMEGIGYTARAEVRPAISVG
ncbi:MAG: DNA cytosine methyltransferase, partial [Shewanella sp.]